MKQLLLSLLALVSLSPVANAASYRSVQYFDSVTNVTARVIANTIQPDVQRVHTGIDPVTGKLKFYFFSYQQNMCVLELRHCSSAQKAAGLSESACQHVTRSLRCK